MILRENHSKPHAPRCIFNIIAAWRDNTINDSPTVINHKTIALVLFLKATRAIKRDMRIKSIEIIYNKNLYIKLFYNTYLSPILQQKYLTSIIFLLL